MNEERKFLNLSDEELADCLEKCSDKDLESHMCRKCPYDTSVHMLPIENLSCFDRLMCDAAARIRNLKKQNDILAGMVKLDEE